MKKSIQKVTCMMAMIGMMAVSLLGCSTVNQQSSTQSDAGSVSDTQNDSAPTSNTQTGKETSSQTQKQKAVLYIGREDSFKEYAYEYEGELKPETLIQGISDTTGWDLSLADEVTTGKGGMTVSFAKTSALFVGPPETQKEEFFMYDADTLITTILDSVKKTLQENFVDTSAGGDPESLPIYYCMEGNQPLTFENLNVTIPMDEPYTSMPKG